MDWSEVTNNPLILGAAAAVVVVILLLVGILRRRKNSSPEAQIITPQDVISQMGSFSPSFSVMMESYISKQNLANFLQQEEVSSAFERLEVFLQRKQASATKKDKKGLLHFEDTPALESDIKAALITIARCVYADDAYQAEVDDRDREQFDHLLDSLT